MADLLCDALTVQRKSRVDDGQGGWTETFADVLEVSGRIANVSGRDQAIAAQKKSIITNSAYTEPGTDIREGDRIVCDGRTYEVRVVGVDAPSYPYAKVLVALYVDNI